MKDETTPIPQNIEPQAIIEATPKENKKLSADEAIEHLKAIQENAGQISELEKEEENLINEFFNTLVKILKPFCKTIEIPADSLPEEYSTRVSKAYLNFNGQLTLIYKHGKMETIDLSERENREIIMEIAGDVMASLESIINSYKSKIEKRVKFLMPVTKELQKIAKVFAEK